MWNGWKKTTAARCWNTMPSLRVRVQALMDSLLFIVKNSRGSVARYVLLLGYGAVQLVAVPVWMVVIAAAAIGARYRRRAYHADGTRMPRLVWGPYPQFFISLLARSLAPLGYKMDGVVYYNHDRIWDSGMYAYCLTATYKDGHWLRLPPFEQLLLYPCIFIRLLYAYDIFHGNFFAGYLRHSWLERFEPHFLKLAGCKQISMSIGGDVALLDKIHSPLIRQGYMDVYPETAHPDCQARTRRWVDHYCRHSDFILCQNSYMIDTLKRWDMLVNSIIPFDLDQWKSDHVHRADGRNAAVVIGHSANHRPLKGTNFLIRAVNELRAEGFHIRLNLMEDIKNSDVCTTLGACDIVVADLVLQGYAYMGIEGMALGKPVVQDISDEHYNRVFKLYTPLGEAPFVSVPIEGLKDALRTLITDPALREKIGRESRAFAEKYHSFDAIGQLWHTVYEQVWFKRGGRLAFYHPDQKTSPISSLNTVVLSEREKAMQAALKDTLDGLRSRSPDAPIAFYPCTHATADLLESLLKAKVLRSGDVLISPDARPREGKLWHFANDYVPLAALDGTQARCLVLLEKTPAAFGDLRVLTELVADNA